MDKVLQDLKHLSFPMISICLSPLSSFSHVVHLSYLTRSGKPNLADFIKKKHCNRGEAKVDNDCFEG